MGTEEPEVTNFANHIQYMEPFHRRVMASRKAVDLWLSACKLLEVDMIAPQHGAMMRGEMVKEFYSWFGQLSCGLDEMNSPKAL